MKILKLVGYDITTPTARVYKSKDNKSYFNLSHGKRGSGLWNWVATIDTSIGQPKNDDDVLLLDRNDYVIIPCTKQNKPVKDLKGNISYNVTCEHDDVDNDIMLLWTPTTKHFKDVKIEITGGVDEIGMAYYGKHYKTESYSIPSPILILFASATLSWTGTDYNNNKYKQTITYNPYDKEPWDIGNITKL